MIMGLQKMKQNSYIHNKNLSLVFKKDMKRKGLEEFKTEFYQESLIDHKTTGDSSSFA